MVKKPKAKVPIARANKKRRELLDFAQEHGFTINPAVGYDYYVDGYFMFNHCPCDPTRKECPCSQAREEVETNGHCLCHLFWKDPRAFKENKLKE